MQGRSADAQRVLQALVRACAEAINGKGLAFDSKFAHGVVLEVGVGAKLIGYAKSLR